MKTEDKAYTLFTYLGMDFSCMYQYLLDAEDKSVYVDELKSILNICINTDILRAVNSINKEYDTDIHYTLKELKEEYMDLVKVIEHYFTITEVKQ